VDLSLKYQLLIVRNYQLSSFIKQPKDIRLFFSEQEHYTLLSSLSERYTNQVLYDLGTYKGLSALALSSNPTNKIVSYDIGYFVEIQRPENVEFRIGNFFTDKEILTSPLIMFDVDPHDGKIEKRFLDWLGLNAYRGSVVFDDIHLNDEMKAFWASITQEKVDYTEIGHWSGTGLVILQ